MSGEMPNPPEPIKPPEQPTPFAAERHAIVTYWTNALKNSFVSNATDVGLAQQARSFAERLQPVSEDQLLTFAGSLATRLENRINTMDEFDREDLLSGWKRLTIGMDFQPDEILGRAAAEAGIGALQLRFPHKTWTHMKPGEVTVYRDADRREEKIYPPKEPEKSELP